MPLLNHPLVTAIIGALLAVASVLLLGPALAGNGAWTDEGHDVEQLSPSDDLEPRRSRSFRRNHNPGEARHDVAAPQVDPTDEAPLEMDAPPATTPGDPDESPAPTDGDTGDGGDVSAGPDTDADDGPSPDDGAEDGHGGGGPSTPLPLGPMDFGLTPSPPPVFDLVAPKGVALGPGGKAVASGDLATDVGCGGDCVTHATVRPGGKDARFRVTTDRPARITLVVNGVAKKDSGATPTQDWQVAFDGLTPATTYQVLLLAEDANGMVTKHVGSFETQKRYVAVTFSDVHVRRITHHGDIEFHFGTTGTGWHHQLATSPQRVKAGEWVHFSNKTVLLEDAPRYLNLRVQGAEHRNQTAKFCSESVPSLHDGKSDCYALATAWMPSMTGIDVDALPVGPQALPGPAHAVVLDSYAIGLEITAYVSLDVWYG